MAHSRLLSAVVAVTVIVAAGIYLLLRLDGAVDSTECQVRVGDDTVTLEQAQAENAALIAAIGVRRELPERAVAIALATAYQESKIVNVDFGDRDSLGLFQQRPSQGWGTAEQVQDPVYATEAFYDALVQVDEYRSLPIHDTAQAVQRSADGSAYEQHESNAQVLAAALTGRAPAALSCEVATPDDSGQAEGADGLTDNARTVRSDVRSAFGRLPQGGYAAGGVSTGHSAGSTHYEGRAIDFFFRPAGGPRARNGWALAHYLVAQAVRLQVSTVIFEEKIWTARRSDDGWRDYEVAGAEEDQDVLLHRDHVHVDVA